MTFGLSTFYNKITHNKLWKVMYQDFCFDGSDNTYVSVSKYGG